MRSLRRTALALALASLAALSAAPAQAKVTHLFSKSFTPTVGFGFPLGVAINQGTQEVYVTDYNAGSVYAFEASGAPDPTHPKLTEADGTTPYPFSNPYGVAVDNTAGTRHGDIYVANAGTVAQFDPSGARTAQAPITAADVSAEGTAQSGGLPAVLNNGGLTPTGVAVASNGDVYVADQSNNVVDLFEPNGTFVSQLAAGQISGPNLIATDPSGDLYVANNANGTIEFEPSGVCANSCMPIDPAANLGVATDAVGNVYADEGGRITEFDSSANATGSFGTPTANPPFGGISSSFDLAVDNTSGNVYAADAGSGRVDIFGPAITLPDTTTNEATGVTSTAATLRGTVDPAGGGKVTECHFQYVTEEAFDQTGYSNLQSGGNVPCSPPTPYIAETEAPVSAEVTNLPAQIAYRYRIVAANASGENQGEDQTFETLPAVSISTSTPSPLQATTATLHGKVNPAGNGDITACHFEYLSEEAFNGNGGNYSNAQTATCSPPTPYAGEAEVFAEIVGLSPATAYHLRLVATDSAGTTTGSDQSFTTLPAVASLSTDPATNIVPGSATLNGSYQGEEGNDTHYYFEYGTTTSYGQITATPPGVDHGSNGGNQEVGTEINLLFPYTLYHYRIVATDDFGTTYGLDQSFYSEPPNLPSVDSTTSSGVTPEGASLEAEVNPAFGPTVVRFEYGTNGSYGFKTPLSESIGNDGSDHAISSAITGLQPATTYHYRALAVNFRGLVMGPDRTLNTTDSPAISATAASAISQTAATLSAQVKPGFSSATYHFEYGTGASYGQNTPNGPPTGPDDAVHLASTSLASLAPATTYHYRIVATNEIGTSDGPDQIFTTASPDVKKAPPSSTCKKGHVLKHGKCVKKPRPRSKHHKRAAHNRGGGK
jgi:NHL repeat